jgi:hypothetical protein
LLSGICGSIASQKREGILGTIKGEEGKSKQTPKHDREVPAFGERELWRH